MAAPVADAYVAPSGAAVYAGRFPSSHLYGNISLDDIQASGALSSAAGGGISGNATLGDVSASGGLASGPITIDGNYERSSLEILNSSVTGAGDAALVFIAPKGQESEVVGMERWLYPSADIINVLGFMPKFRLGYYFDSAGGMHYYSNAVPSGKHMMYRNEGETNWRYFEVTTPNVGGQYIEFYNTVPFTANKIRIGFSRQWTLHEIGTRLDAQAAAYSFFVPSVAAAAWTPSASVSGFDGQSFIADEYTAQVDSLGVTIPITPLYCAEINDTSLTPTSGGAKRVACLTGGVHAGENQGIWTLFSMVDWLCGSTTEAIRLRREWCIKIAPCLNAPGLAGGGWRGSFTQGISGYDDANRHYHQTDTTLEIVDKPIALMHTERGAQMFDWVVDCHGGIPNKWSTYQTGGDTYQASWFSYWNTHYGSALPVEGTDITGNWASSWKTRGAKLCVTFETADPVDVSDAEFTAVGGTLCKILNSMWNDGSFA